MTATITKKIFYNILACTLFIVVGSSSVSAQPCTGPGCPPCEDGTVPDDSGECVDNPAVPVDGGVSILIAAGVAYGLKRAYDKRKQNKEANLV